MSRFQVVNGATISATVLKGTFQNGVQQINMHDYMAVAAKKPHHPKPNAHKHRSKLHFLPKHRNFFSVLSHIHSSVSLHNLFLNTEDSKDNCDMGNSFNG